MDLAITYRCNNDCAHCYNARERNYRRFTEQWRRIIDKLWEIGIPHVVFTGGEPTLRKDLRIDRPCWQNGQISNINTNGRRLKDPLYVESLVNAGLDHAQITVESHDPAIHDNMVAAQGAWQDTVQGIKNVLQTRLFVMTNSTLLVNNTPCLPATSISWMTGVPAVGESA